MKPDTSVRMKPDTSVRISPKPRDAHASREAIVAAAVEVFSQKGYFATSVADIAVAAKVAKGTPSYFFGNKDGLWQAAIEQVSNLALEIVPNALQKTQGKTDLPTLVDVFIETYADFHQAHPEFLRLMYWTTLQGIHLHEKIHAHIENSASALNAVMLTLSSAGSSEDAVQTLLSVIGAANAHVLYGSTLITPLGIDPNSSEFFTARKAHLKRLMLASLQSASHQAQ
jgi:TetR/AcrR family transcriptional regulator